MTSDRSIPNSRGPSPEVIARFIDSWQFSLSARGQDEYLMSPERHQYLHTLWDHCAGRVSWIEAETVPGIRLVDHIEMPSDNHLSYVCRGVQASGIAVCVKFAWTSRHFAPERNEGRCRAILNEVDVLRRMKGIVFEHGVIPEFIDASEVVSPDGLKVPYIVTRYIPGLQRLNDTAQRLSKPALIELLEGFCRLAGEFHRHGVVHGDLSSANLHTSFGRPVIIDFGAAQRTRPGLFRRTRTPRYFRPRIPFSIQEHDDPALPLRPSYDVACLGYLINLVLSERTTVRPLTPASAEKNGSSDNSPDGWQARLSSLHRECIHYEPAYRLSNGTELSKAMRSLTEGPVIQPRYSFRTHIVAKSERYRGFLMAAAAIVTVILTAVVVCLLFYQQVREREQKALVASLRELRTRFHGSRGDGNFVRERKSTDIMRQEISSLLEDMDMTSPSPEAAALAVQLSIELVQSLVDQEGFFEAQATARANTRLASQLATGSPDDLALQLLCFESAALQVRCDVECSKLSMEGEDGSVDASCQALSKDVVAGFAALCRQPCSPEQRSQLHRTAVQMTSMVLRPQLRFAWMQKEEFCTVYELTEAALAVPRVVDDAGDGYWYASLMAFRAFAKHKSAYWPSSQSGVAATQQIRDELTEAVRLVELGKVLDTERLHDWPNLAAQVHSVLGLSLCNHPPRRLAEARKWLEPAYEYFLVQSQNMPLSLTRQRYVADAGWSLADVLFEQRDETSLPETLHTLQLQEADIRRRVYVLARQLFLQDISAGNRVRFQVAAARLAMVLQELGKFNEAAEIASEMVAQSLLPAPPAGHGAGDEFLGALATAYRRSTSPETLLAYQSQTQHVLQQLRGLIQKNKLHRKIQHRILTTIRQQIDQVPECAAHAEWKLIVSEMESNAASGNLQQQ